MVYYLAIKRNKILIHALTWTNLKNIMLSGICGQSLKAIYFVIPSGTLHAISFHDMYVTGRSVETERRSVVASGWGNRVQIGSNC